MYKAVKHLFTITGEKPVCIEGHRGETMIMWINMKIQLYPQKVFVNPAVPAAASRGAAFMRSDASLHTGMKDSPRIVVFVGSAKSGMSKR